MTVEVHAGMTVEVYAGMTVEVHAGMTVEVQVWMTTFILSYRPPSRYLCNNPGFLKHAH